MMMRLCFVCLFASACGTAVPEPPTYPPPTNNCTADGATRCAGTVLQVCQSSVWTMSVDCGATGQLCIESAGAPGSYMCGLPSGCLTAGEQRCNLSVIETCDGTAWVAGLDCSLTAATCVEDAGPPVTASCQASSCTTAGEQRCDGTVAQTCDGTQWTVAFNCGSSAEICVEDPGPPVTVSCERPCTGSGTQQCTGTVVDTCNGVHWVAGLDCSTSSQTCVEDGTSASCGEACTLAGQQRCADDVVQTCDGTTWTAGEDCGLAGAVCVELSGPPTAACQSACATPGTQRCNGDMLERCETTFWVPELDCSLAGGTCVADPGPPLLIGCETPCSTPGAERCADDIIETCNGTWWSVASDCGAAGDICVEDPGPPVSATCEEPCTTPGEQRCTGNIVETCFGGYWVFEQNCALIGSICLAGPGTAACQATASCTVSEAGYTRCDGDLLQQCNGSVWNPVEDCFAGGQTCVVVLPGLARCEDVVTSVGLFESCLGSGQGNCASGLTCGTVTLLSSGLLCIIDCTSAPSLCTSIDLGGGGVPGYCEPGSIAGSGSFSSSPFCYPLGGRNDLCLFNDDGCSTANASCTAVVDGLNPECKLTCSGAETGTQPPVCSGQTCLRAPYSEIQDDGLGGDLACTTPGTVDNCNGTQGYECTELSDGTSVTLLCARRAGICGNEAPAAPAFANSTELSTYIGDDTVMCELLGVDQYCGADDGAGATNECTGTGFAFRYDPAISCTGFDDQLGCFGLGECITFDGKIFECGTGIAVCQRFCTGSEGEDLTVGGTVNPCDTGSCQTPAQPIGRPAIEFDGAGSPVFCDQNGDLDCDTGAGFTCDTTTFSDAEVCTQIRLVCSL